jgi:hypothetical protein
LHKKQTGITAGTALQNLSETLVQPKLSGVKPPVPYPITLEPENGKNTGRHSMFSMNKLFLDRGMTVGQIKVVISMVDVN